MMRSRGWNIRSLAISAAFFCTLFLLYVPFEDPEARSMWTRYFAVAVGLFFLTPVMLARPIKITTPSAYVLLTVFFICLHTVLFRQVSFIYPFFIGMNVLLAVLIYETSKKWPKEFNTALIWLLVSNIVALLAQVTMFYLLGGPIVDIHELVFHSPSRTAVDFAGINRFSGLQVEPGTYANNMIILLVAYLFTSQFRKQVYLLAIFTVISVLLTGSATAVYFTCVMLALLPFIWSQHIRIWQVAVLFLFIIAFVAYSDIPQHLTERFGQKDDGSLSIWKTGLRSYLDTGWEEKIIGLGYEHPPCVDCHYQDLGAIFNLISGGGILLLFMLLLLFFRVVYFNGIFLSLVIFAIPMNSRMYYYEAPLWMLFLFAQSNLKKKHLVLQAPGVMHDALLKSK
jgi:hypothetical protein